MTQGVAILAAAPRWLGVLLLCSAALVTPSGAAEEGRITIRDATTHRQAGVWFLDARIDYTLNDAATEALQSGLALDVELVISLTERRRLLWDPEFAGLKQHYELQYHALTERYIVRNLNSGEQATFAGIGAALAHLGNVRYLPLIDDALLDPGERYDVSLRAVLDIKQLGGPLALIGFLWDDWRIVSEWKRWQLRP